MKSRCDSIRPELKLSRGFDEEIDLSVVKNVMRKNGIDPYRCNMYAEFIEFHGWKNRKSIGFIKL